MSERINTGGEFYSAINGEKSTGDYTRFLLHLSIITVRSDFILVGPAVLNHPPDIGQCSDNNTTTYIDRFS